MPCYRVVVLLDGSHFAPIVTAPDPEQAEWRARHLAEQLHQQATYRLVQPPRFLHSHAWHRNGMPSPNEPEPLRG